MVKFKLDQLLKERGITMYQLAKITEIRPNTISQWVNNEDLDDEKKVKSINVDTLVRICKALNCKIEDVIEFVEED